MTKIVMFGSQGRLGRILQKKYPEIVGFGREIDITNSQNLRTIIMNQKPNVIINCAAITDIELCEKEPELCRKVNYDAVKKLAELSQEVGANLVHISSDYALSPVNEYGKAKRESEKVVTPVGIVLRTDLYGKETFLIRKLVFTNDLVQAYEDKFFNPISMASFADILFEMKEKKGIYNIATLERISMFQFALKICKIFQLDEKRVSPSLSSDQNQSVKRPKELFLEPYNSLSIEEDLRRFKHELEIGKDFNNCPSSR